MEDLITVMKDAKLYRLCDKDWFLDRVDLKGDCKVLCSWDNPQLLSVKFRSNGELLMPGDTCFAINAKDRKGGPLMVTVLSMTCEEIKSSYSDSTVKMSPHKTIGPFRKGTVEKRLETMYRNRSEFEVTFLTESDILDMQEDLDLVKSVHMALQYLEGAVYELGKATSRCDGIDRKIMASLERSKEARMWANEAYSDLKGRG